MKKILVHLPGLFFTLSCIAQESNITHVNLPANMVEKVTRTLVKTEAHIQRENLKILSKLQKQEERLYAKLFRIVSIKIGDDYTHVSEQYKILEKIAADPTTVIKQSEPGVYVPRMDSLQTMLKFLQSVTTEKEQLSKALAQADAVKIRLGQAEDIKQFIGKRQNILRNLATTYNILPEELIDKYVGSYSKQCHYYKDKMGNLKEEIKNPEKAEKLALETLNKLPAFKAFMTKNSDLANLFGSQAGSSTAQSLAGLQTRQVVTQQVQQQTAGTGINLQQFVQQQIQTAQTELNSLKAKANELRTDGSDDTDMPDFKPNSQKTKPFLKRLEYSWNLQSGIKHYQFPASNDLAVCVGYRLNDRFTTGIGVAYKFSLGESIKKVEFTHDGIGLRSFIDWKISPSKSTFKVLFNNLWLTGGFEMNYWSKFTGIPELKKVAWQRAGMIGISKKIQYKKKFAKVQVLWDFLKPSENQPLTFRYGYSF